jgi:hypothetical protein
MRQAEYTKEEVAERGEALYERDIRASVERDHHGKDLRVFPRKSKPSSMLASPVT